VSTRYCSKCGTQNENDALFCTKCGFQLKPLEETTKFEKRMKEVTKEFEKASKKTGKKIEQTAKKSSADAEEIGDQVEKTGKHVTNWYDHTFGIFGPLISSFIGLIVLRLIIEAMWIQTNTIDVTGKVGTVLYSYLPLIFAMMLLSSYNSYIIKKYKSFRWASPPIVAVVIVTIVWIVARILLAVETKVNVPDLASTVLILDKYLPMIFTFVILIGYLILMVEVSREKEQK
jgi:ribosomal protein L40E